MKQIEGFLKTTKITSAKALLWGFGQVLAVAFTTVAISQQNYLANAVGSLAVNIFWLYNVSTAMKGSKPDKIGYTIGAVLGSITGSYIGHNLI
jgi:hypothetical protein